MATVLAILGTIAGTLWKIIEPFKQYIVFAVLIIVCWQLLTSQCNCRRARPFFNRTHERTDEVAKVISGREFTVPAGLAGRRERHIFLEGIAVPLPGEPWAEESQAALDRMLCGRTVRTKITDGKRLGSEALTGVVTTPEGTVANLEQVRAGLAWVVGTEYPDWKAAEVVAKKARRGIWSAAVTPDNLDGDKRHVFPNFFRFFHAQ
jgi:endonuclease YncB( thermonuclease family)